MEDLPDKLPHSHPMPMPDPDWCSCCRERIWHTGALKQNVVKVKTIPEKILNMDGEVVDKKEIQGAQGFFHPKCLMEHMGAPSELECKHCGVYKMAKEVPTVGKDWEREMKPIKDFCTCVCHTGKQDCSLIPIYNADERMYGKTHE